MPADSFSSLRCARYAALLAGLSVITSAYALDEGDILNPKTPRTAPSQNSNLPDILNGKDGCNAQTIGTAIGGLLGGVIGRSLDDGSTKGTVIGGAVGAAAGNMIARELEKNGTLCNDGRARREDGTRSPERAPDSPNTSPQPPATPAEKERGDVVQI